MLEPGPYKLHLHPVHFGPMGLMTTIHPEAVDQLVVGVEEDLIQLEDSYFDAESPKCTGHKTSNTMTVKMSDCNKYHIYLLFFFSLDPYTLRKHTQCLFYFLDSTFINKMHHGKKNLPLKTPFAFMVRHA